MLEWAQKGQQWEQNDYRLMLKALTAYLGNLAGNRPLAIAGFRASRLYFRRQEIIRHYFANTPMRERIDWALAGLLAIHPPWLGINYEEMDEDLTTSLGLPAGQGLFITDVKPGSPAEAGGLAAGDVIIAIEGQPATGLQALQNQLVTKVAGDSLALTDDYR